MQLLTTCYVPYFWIQNIPALVPIDLDLQARQLVITAQHAQLCTEQVLCQSVAHLSEAVLQTYALAGSQRAPWEQGSA